ncbi:hypothetical protein [Jiulongibacter sp. NS-SX5]|uniref:hypothetical protein n=1 Tax=Jiulongibacter sp. NS-SX5 TaxID=3463854 RepID=UPI0040596824
MEQEIHCKHCSTVVIVIENRLFYSEQQSLMDINCPTCKSRLSTKSTDGWFFTQSKEEFLKDIEIEKKKEKFLYPMA